MQAITKIVVFALAILGLAMECQGALGDYKKYPPYFCYFRQCLRSCVANGMHGLCLTNATCEIYTECENSVCTQDSKGVEICEQNSDAFTKVENNTIQGYVLGVVKSGRGIVSGIGDFIKNRFGRRIRNAEDLIKRLLSGLKF
ncbi:hypothetical protein C0J52_17999 [Blattella germanica]|nr:hypothetical protein C0J52_17999 [Blattella germanica]